MSNSHASLGKRFLSVLLVMVMVIGMLPTFALAAPASGTIGNYNFTYELVPHRILDASTTETTDVDAVVTIYGDGTTAVGTKGTIKIEVGSQSVTVENVRGKDGTSKYGLETTTNNENVKLQEGAIIVTVRNVATGVAANANATATIAVTVTPDNGNPANTVTGSATVTQPVGMTAQHFLGDGALEAAVEYVAPPTPIGKTVNVPVTVKLYSERAASSAGTVENAKFSVSLGNTASTAISMVDYDQQNGMQRNGRTFLPVSNAPVFDINVVWHKNGDDHAVLGSRGFFEWHTTMQSLSPGDNSIKYALDEEGGWYNKNVGSITVHVPTCAVNVPSAVVSTADLVVTYQTEVKNGSVAVVYNGKTFTTGTDVDLSDGVAKITIPKADLDTGWTSLYAVQTTESGVKSVPADATLNFVDEAFDVTFKNGTAVHATQTVAKGGYASRPSDPTALGKKFVGWFTTAGGPDPFNFNTKITESTTVYAHFVPDATPTKDVNFYVDSTVYETQTVVLGGYLSRPTDPVKPGYMFVDWVTAPGGDTSYNFATAVTGSTGNAYAKFASTGASRDVTFYWDDGTTVYEVQHVANGGHAVRPTNPVKAGYEFLDWYTWDPATDDDDGDGAVDQNELETKFNFGTAINADGVKVYAKFKEVSKTYTVTYLVNGKKVDQEKGVAHNAKIYAPADPVVEGYTFGGWYTWDKSTEDTDGDGVADADELTNKFAFANETTPATITADTTLYAKLVKIGEVTITYADGDAGGAAVKNKPADTAVLKGAEYTIPAITPTAEGYTFKGWKIGDGASALIVQPGYTFTVTDATTITAQWEKIPNKVTVTFDDGDGDPDQLITVPDNVIVDEGSSFVISNFVPERAGYIFKGWKEGSYTYAPGATYNVAVGATSVTLTAQWAADLVTVTAGTVGTGATLAGLPTVAITRGTEVAFTVTVAAGYDPAALVVKANDVALAYSAVNGNVYHYSFVANADTTITVSDLATLSYTVTMPVGDNFTAEFTPVTDPATTSKTVTHGDDYSFVVTPDAGYNIKGVYVNGVKQSPDTTDTATKAETFKITNVTGPQTIEVSVDEIPVYTVTYVVNNAQFTTQKVSKGAQITTLPENPVIDGYTFNGWATTNGKTETTDADVTAATTVSADMTVYAVLKANTYTVTYNGNGSDGGTVPGAQTKIHGVALNLSTDVPTRTGYKFLGWGTDADATVVSYQPGQTYSADANLALYAVWEQLTFTVTLPSGTGFTVNALDSTTVKYGADFKFEVIVDRAYAKTAPVVEVNGNPLNGTGATSDSTSATWTYTITGVKEDKQVAISVTMNPTHVVTFKTWLTDVDPTAEHTTLYMTQKVENGYPAAQPAAPVVEGYIFGGWVWDDPATAETTLVDYSFATLVNTPVTIVAKMKPIVPVVTWTDGTTPEDGWDITGKTAVLVAPDVTVDDGSNSVKYGSDMTFTVTIGEGWDASKMAVGANGLALAPTSVEEKADGTVVYTYLLSNITENTNITVSGVVRKTVTITYNANARDDVSDMPEQQVVNYYLSGASDNSDITNQIPVRTGYTFLGWAKANANGTIPTAPAYSNPAKTAADDGYDTSKVADFTSDTTLYAIWKANSTTIGLTVSDTVDDTAANKQEYEGQKVTLTATIAAAPSTGSVIFYQSSDNGTTWTVISSQSANGSDKYTFEATTGAYAGTDTYKAEYKAEGDEGYSDDTSDTVSVDRLSTTITWKLDSDAVLNTAPAGEGPAYYYASTLTITPDGGSALTPGVAMTAGQTYILTAPAVYELGTTTALTVGTDYTITWQYLDGANGWTTRAENQTTSTYKVTSEYSEYQFRALMVVNTGVSTVYTKAAKFESEYYGARQTKTMSWLISEPTPAVVLQQTTTTLTITAPTEGASEWKAIDGADVKFLNKHFVQFEGQTVTLNAQVKDASDALVQSGKVYFYRYVDGINVVKLNATAVEVVDGVAQLKDVAISDYNTAKHPKQNADKFYAVYEENATYDDSSSLPVAGPDVLKHTVYIKSTTIQTPVINSALSGKRGSVTGATSTSYTEDLTELQAGVKHTFTLKTTGANTTDTADWSVVALDGRTVASTDYDIVWNVKTGDNTVTDATVGGTFVTTDNKVGDEISVTLIAKNDMKVDATSKKAIIGTKQDVNVTVTASDKIASTSATDAYQLDEVTLTATVAAAQGANATVKPSGTVAFYYQDGTSWVYLGEAVLTKDTDGQMRASIDTTKLPVTDTTNVKRDVEITAVYLGDNTFNVSRNYNETTREVSAGTTTNGVTDETVTVYSSVVYVNSGVENVASNTVGQNHTSGIYIYAEEDKVLANETNVNLKLSDVYTLDHADALSKLVYGVDYTVQWQKLSNAASYASDYADEEVPWQPITSANGTICQIDVEDGAAYRAVITVTDTPIAKGSYTEVDQDIDGRRVYYSNILVASDAPATVTVNVNTSNVADGYEGIVEGETVTIHTFTSGATGTTPISELTMVITDEGGNEVDKQVKTNVNGHVSFDWAAAAPGYYTMTLTAKFTNGYSDKTIVRELIVRDNNYSFTTSGDGVAYNGKAQFLKVAVGDMGIENALAQKSVVVYYYDKDGKQVEPTQAGTYKAKIRLQESAYWTEKTMDTTFTIAKRQLSIEDVIVQAKVYDGDVKANVQEIILKDAATNQTTGLPNVTTGVINGDSVYVTGTAVTNSADVKDATTVTVTAGELQGKDAANYELQVKTFSEAFKIQRSQVQGDIADATYKYGTTKVPAEDIYLIDQAGTVLDADDYTVTYYYHSGNGVKQVSAMNWKGMYTVIARPDQNNYKGGASQTVYVADAAVDADPVKNAKSALISITNTVELFGDANNKGIQATATKGTAVVKYNVGGAWVDTAPTAAGRYLVKVTAEENSAVIGTAYGLYTVVKTYPDYSIEAADADYNSAQYAASSITTNAPAGTYFTYTGGTIQGVAYEAPTEVGTYVVTAHIPEGTDAQGTVAHEISDTFEIKPIALKITADSLQRRQYGAFPDMTASFDGLATGGVAVDTSLRDVQIQPELIFNAAYSNDAMDQVGSYTITAVAALARNYKVSYETGLMTVTADEPNPYLAIHGMIDNGTTTENIAYYGDVIQLYAYGSQSETTGVINNSSVLTWKVTGPAEFVPDHDGLLKITGVGTVVVTLKRGIGAQQISTTLTIDARKQEVKVVLESDDVVYSGTQQTYDESGKQAINAKLKHVSNSLNAKIEIDEATNKRTDIGSQIVEATVSSSTKFYQSETYGGLFTINDKEATVAPVGRSVQYSKDLGTLTHTEKDSNGNMITDALSNEQIASIRSDYINLDAGTYEILVAGTEDMNYNVKYTTNPNAEVVTVTALENTLKYTTGVIAGSTGRTNGYLQAADKFYPDEGAVVTYADPTVEPNDRMYGEPNPAMNYLFNGLIAGDSAADLVKLIELVGFVPGIDKEANVAFTDAHISASGVATGKSGTYLSGKSYYETTTALPVNGVKNYLMENTDITLGIQNVYQRPFTLKLTGNKTDLRVYKPLVINGSTVNKAKLLEIILDNMEVVEYESGGKKYGGLATKLGHTINDVNLEIVSATYNSVAGTINVELKCNDNYWLSNKNWTIVVDPSMITVSYGTLGKYSSSVTMYGIDEDGNNIGATDVTGKVWYEIYVEDTSLQRKYSNYKDLTPVVRVQMTKGNGTGVYVANYNSTPLSAGHYVMFAIAEDYTIIE